MKKIIEKEVTFCDNCGKEAGLVLECVTCETELCFDCSDQLMVRLYVGMDRGNTAYICKKCFDRPETIAGIEREKYDHLMNVKAVRAEYEAVYQSQKKRDKVINKNRERLKLN